MEKTTTLGQIEVCKKVLSMSLLVYNLIPGKSAYIKVIVLDLGLESSESFPAKGWAETKRLNIFCKFETIVKPTHNSAAWIIFMTKEWKMWGWVRTKKLEAD